MKAKEKIDRRVLYAIARSLLRDINEDFFFDVANEFCDDWFLDGNVPRFHDDEQVVSLMADMIGEMETSQLD